MGRTYAKKGDHNAICDVCGFKKKASQLKLRWDGLRVCKEDWEPRHPSDYYRAPMGVESQVPWTRPEPNDLAIEVTFTGGTSTPLPGSSFDPIETAAAGDYVIGLILTRGLGLGIGAPEYIVTQGFEEA